MEPRELVPGVRERGEACEIREKKRCIRDNVERGEVIVMVSATQSRNLVGGERTIKKELDDTSRRRGIAAFSVHSLAGENFDEDNEDGDKENAGEKHVLGEAKSPARGNREMDKISPLQQRANRSPRHESVSRIPRPANAFMLFANEWRKKLAAENPRESNKDISVRLGIFWKNMSTELKEKYFALAREVDAEHKRKYPDYVYNPKEARLRKAMREQNREQSRERSRRSILQSAIAIANARGTPIAAVSAATVAGGFLNQHHRFDCVSAASVPMPGPAGMAVHRAQTEPPWYQTAHRPKPVHSPRIGDWYGGVDGDPIERLQAMGAMHQQQQQQQRGLDKPPSVVKEQRNQECAATAAFSSNGHSPDFAAAERELRRQETAADYADFVDGQKWHPYQNSAGPHPHPRTSHPSAQMGGILHPSVQNANAHGHAHGPWGQFCHGVLPHLPTVTHSAAIRGPRHAVFLRDRPPTRHCAFPEDASRMGYAPSKLDVDGIRASYPSPEHQMPRLLESAMDSVVDSTATMSRRDEDDGTRWGEANNVAADVSPLDELVPTSSMPQEGAVAREKERESWRTSERFEPKRKPVSRQPLPGFHQAFGSTEIGKFSRSEFFVNMVGENGNGSGGGVNGDVGDADDGDVSRERPPLLEAAAAAAAATAAAAAAAAAAAVAATTNAGRTFDAADQGFAVGDGVASYRGQPATTTTPRWHSPHLIPEAYCLTTPLLFPFPPTSRNVLGVNVVHGIVEDARLVSSQHVLSNGCCWFARTGHAITRIPDDLVAGALLDYSHRANEREWVRRKATIAHVPVGYPVLLGGNRGADYERIVGDRAQRSYVVVDETGIQDVGRERGGEAVNLKIEQKNAVVSTSVHESVEKKN